MDPTADIAAPAIVEELAEEMPAPLAEAAPAKKSRGWARLKRHRNADSTPETVPDPAAFAAESALAAAEPSNA